MPKLPLILIFAAILAAPQLARGAEGGYSNYIAGTYGDFGMALAPAETWTLRNDLYFYDASSKLSLRSGKIEVGADLDFFMNFTTLLYKSELEVFGAQFAAGVFVPLVDLDIDSSLRIGDQLISVSDSASGLGDLVLIPFALLE